MNPMDAPDGTDVNLYHGSHDEPSVRRAARVVRPLRRARTRRTDPVQGFAERRPRRPPRCPRATYGRGSGHAGRSRSPATARRSRTESPRPRGWSSSNASAPGPPRLSPWRIDAVDRLINTVEYFVHHEDIRRAPTGLVGPRARRGARRRSLRLAEARREADDPHRQSASSSSRPTSSPRSPPTRVAGGVDGAGAGRRVRRLPSTGRQAGALHRVRQPPDAVASVADARRRSAC